jgi:uncharacterized membrane protein YtjA (UPF0391 family)
MFGPVVTLLIIALIAGILGFGGIAGAAVGFAKIIFLVALILLVVSLLFGGLRGGLADRSERWLAYLRTHNNNADRRPVGAVSMAR